VEVQYVQDGLLGTHQLEAVSGQTILRAYAIG
jgi:hypothetical protein